MADFILTKARISLYNALAVIAVAENKLADLSTDFAVEILKLTDGMKGHDSLVNQLERSATSIGANIREAKYAHSKPDNDISTLTLTELGWNFYVQNVFFFEMALIQLCNE